MDNETNENETNLPSAGQNTDGEYYGCAAVYTAVALFFLVVAMICLLGEYLGSKPRFVKWELNNMVGPVVFSPKHFSMSFGGWILAGAIMSFLAWVKNDQNINLVTVTGMCILCAFALIEVGWRLATDCPKWKHFTVMTIILAALVIWRCVRFTNPSHYNWLLIPIFVNLGLAIGDWMMFFMRRKSFEKEINLLKQYRVYIENNPKFVWRKGASQPDGLVVNADLA